MMKINKLTLAFPLVGALLFLNVTSGFAQTASPHHTMHQGKIPTLAGQDAFGAMQEIITILESDPETDWSRVNIGALRTHLVDMNRLVMDADVRENNIDGGLEITVTAQGRTLQAIISMVPAHALMIDGTKGWTATAEETTTGVILRVTTSTDKEVAHIRGLGFFGLMVSGHHHQAHHLGLARGKNVHGKTL